MIYFIIINYILYLLIEHIMRGNSDINNKSVSKVHISLIELEGNQ